MTSTTPLTKSLHSAEVPVLVSSPLCGVTIDSSQLSQKILFFNFDGITPCFSPSRTRSGQIKVQLTTGTNWHLAGSVLTITYNNFKITRLSDNKTITFNGVKTLTNVNGHNWLTFLAGTSSFKYQSRAFNVNVAYDDGSTAVRIRQILQNGRMSHLEIMVLTSYLQPMVILQ